MKSLAPSCRVCGCTDDRACEGGCWWVEPMLCSACAGVVRVRHGGFSFCRTAKVELRGVAEADQAKVRAVFGFAGATGTASRPHVVVCLPHWTVAAANVRFHRPAWNCGWKQGPRPVPLRPFVQDLGGRTSTAGENLLLAAAGFTGDRRRPGAELARLAVRLTEFRIEAGPVVLFAADVGRPSTPPALATRGKLLGLVG